MPLYISLSSPNQVKVGAVTGEDGVTTVTAKKRSKHVAIKVDQHIVQGYKNLYMALSRDNDEFNGQDEDILVVTTATPPEKVSWSLLLLVVVLRHSAIPYWSMYASSSLHVSLSLFLLSIDSVLLVCGGTLKHFTPLGCLRLPRCRPFLHPAGSRYVWARSPWDMRVSRLTIIWMAGWVSIQLVYSHHLP